MENWFVSSVGEVCKSIKKVSNFYATTITFAMSTTSTLCSKLSGVLRVTHSSQRRGIWNEISLLVVSVLDIFTQKKFTNWETLFEKLDAINIPYKNEQKLFKKLAIFDFESIRVKDANSYKQTETTTWIGKHVPLSVSIPSNLIWEPSFLCNANLHHLIYEG